MGSASGARRTNGRHGQEAGGEAGEGRPAAIHSESLVPRHAVQLTRLRADRVGSMGFALNPHEKEDLYPNQQWAKTEK